MSSLHRTALLGLTLAGLCISAVFGEDRIGCDEVNWEQQVLLNFDGIEEACQEVVVRDGNRYVRFEVEFDHATKDDAFCVLLKLRDGTRVERVFPAPRDFQVSSRSGKSTFGVHELADGDVLDVYIPMSLVVAAAPAR